MCNNGYQTPSAMKYFGDGIIKITISKNGIGIKGQKVDKQVRNQRNGAQVLLENETTLYILKYFLSLF